VELSFAFGRRFWGKSYAFEASQAMLRYAFDQLRLPRIVNGTGDDNLRSIALHKRLGFRIFRALPNGDGIVAVLDNDSDPAFA
jgi:RimJ/RimL family protein N-acetyltransferase